MNNIIELEDEMLDKNNNKDVFISYLKETNKEKTEIEELLVALEINGFFDAPCSGGNHLCVPGGLLEHSLNVCKYALKLGEALLPDNDFIRMRSSIIISSLLHDVGKIGDFGKKLYIPNILKNGKQSSAKPYERNKDLSNVPHSIRSIKFIEDFFDLTEDEEWAILAHDGLYDFMQYQIKGHETPLYLIIHTADFYSSRFVESVGIEDNENQ